METPKELQPPTEWPKSGSLEFRNVSLRYREGLPLALNDLSFAIPAGKTCGIVGRTGAGKSSITVALFRLVEIEPNLGSILLDGIDLTKLGLSDVRGRGMSIIQEMLRTRFPQTTLLTIAHRLNTIMDYDCVLVMDAGRAAEFDAPAKLLENDEGIFSQLVDATGAESSKALRQLAKKSFESKQH